MSDIYFFNVVFLVNNPNFSLSVKKKTLCKINITAMYLQYRVDDIDNLGNISQIRKLNFNKKKNSLIMCQ